MAESGTTSLYQAPLLSRLAVNTKNRKAIADRVLTKVPVPKLQFLYPEFDRAKMFKPRKTRMTSNAVVNMMDVAVSKKSGICNVESIAAALDPIEVEMAGSEIPLQAVKTQVLAAQLILRREIDVATAMRDTTVMINNRTLAGAQQWSDPTSDPYGDVTAARDSLPIPANKLIVSRPVATKLRTHPKILDVTKYTTQGIVPWDALAAYFELEEIIVGEMIYDTAPEGQAESRSFVWGKDAILAYVTDAPPDMTMEQPTVGYLPTLESSGMDYRVYVGKDTTRGTGEGSSIVKVETAYGVLLNGQSVAGYLFKNAVA